MNKPCEVCGDDGEIVNVLQEQGGVPEERVLCLAHQMTEVDLGAWSVELRGPEEPDH